MSRQPVRQDTAATLYYVDGYTYDQIATEMEIGRETVKSNLRYWRERHGIESRRDALAWFRQAVDA